MDDCGSSSSFSSSSDSGWSSSSSSNNDSSWSSSSFSSSNNDSSWSSSSFPSSDSGWSSSSFNNDSGWSSSHNNDYGCSPNSNNNDSGWSPGWSSNSDSGWAASSSDSGWGSSSSDNHHHHHHHHDSGSGSDSSSGSSYTQSSFDFASFYSPLTSSPFLTTDNNNNNTGSSSFGSSSSSFSQDSDTTTTTRDIFERPLPPAGVDLVWLLAKNRQRRIQNPELANAATSVLKSGWLTRVPQKKTGLMALLPSTPERRWVVLTPTVLTYFTNETMVMPVNHIRLNQCIVGEVPGGGNNNNFRVKVGRHYKDFQAADSAATKSWVTAIRSACVLNRYLSMSALARQQIDNRLVTFVAGPPSDKLSLPTLPIGGLTAKAACELFRFSNATILSLKGALGKDALATMIAGLIKAHPGVHRINLSDNEITDDGAGKLAAALASNTMLVSLDLSKNKLTSVGADHFIKALQDNKTIQQVILTGNPLTGNGDASTAVVDALAAEPRIKFLAAD